MGKKCMTSTAQPMKYYDVKPGQRAQSYGNSYGDIATTWKRPWDTSWWQRWPLTQPVQLNTEEKEEEVWPILGQVKTMLSLRDPTSYGRDSKSEGHFSCSPVGSDPSALLLVLLSFCLTSCRLRTAISRRPTLSTKNLQNFIECVSTAPKMDHVYRDHKIGRRWQRSVFSEFFETRFKK